MARDFMQLKVNAWQDDDWTALTLEQQAVYLMLSSQATTNLAGVLDYLPGRLSRLSAGTTPAHIANRVEAVRRRRIAAAAPIEVNAADSGDVAHELETRKRLIDAIAAGKMTKHQYMAYKAGIEPLETFSGAHQLTTTRTPDQ